MGHVLDRGSIPLGSTNQYCHSWIYRDHSGTKKIPAGLISGRDFWLIVLRLIILCCDRCSAFNATCSLTAFSFWVRNDCRCFFSICLLTASFSRFKISSSSGPTASVHLLRSDRSWLCNPGASAVPDHSEQQFPERWPAGSD